MEGISLRKAKRRRRWCEVQRRGDPVEVRLERVTSDGAWPSRIVEDVRVRPDVNVRVDQRAAPKATRRDDADPGQESHIVEPMEVVSLSPGLPPEEVTDVRDVARKAPVPVVSPALENEHLLRCLEIARP